MHICMYLHLSPYLFIYSLVCEVTSIFIRAHVYVSISACVYTHTYIPTYTYTCAYINICVYIYAFSFDLFIYLHTYLSLSLSLGAVGCGPYLKTSTLAVTRMSRRTMNYE